MELLIIVICSCVCSYIAYKKEKNVVIAFILGFLFNIIAVIGYILSSKTKKLTKEVFEKFVEESYFVKISANLFLGGLQVSSGSETLNGLGKLGFDTTESVVEYFIKKGFELKEHNERTNTYRLQKK